MLVQCLYIGIYKDLMQGPPIHILVEMKIISFGPIDEVNQEYNLDIFFRQWWWDRNLVGAVNESLTMAIDIGDLAWKPDTYFTNAKDLRFSYVTKETMRVIIKPDGSVYYSARINLKVNCIMDFSVFPMDVQSCPLFIESYSYTTQEIYYTWHTSKGDLAATQGVEWMASNGPLFRMDQVTTNHKYISSNSKGRFSRLTVTFHLKRRPGYYIWNFYIPSALLVAMTWVTFWIPVSSYPARVTVCVTSFFTNMLIMDSSGEALARVSYLKAIDWYLIGNSMFVVLSLMEYVFVLNVSGNMLWVWKEKIKKKFGNENDDSNPNNNRNEISESSFKGNHEENEFKLTNNFRSTKKKTLDKCFKCIQLRWCTHNSNPFDVVCYSCSNENLGRLHPVDYICRILFPLMYAAFLIVYATYYDII